MAPTLELLIASRALQGLGAAGMLALTMAFVAQTVPKARTGSAMGLLGTMSAVGTALGPSLGGILIAGFGWRAIFLVNVPLGLLTLFLAHRFLPTDSREADAGPTGFDYVGTLLLALTLGAYALAVTIEDGTFGPFNLTLMLAAVAGLTLFIVAEARTASPLIRLGMFRDPVLSAGLITSALVSTVLMTTLVVGPFYLSRALELDPASVGLVMSMGPLVAALISAPAGRAVDRLGATRMILVGLIGVTGRFRRPVLDARGVGRSRLRRTTRGHHRQLRAFPGRQQHRCHVECPLEPPRSCLRHGESVAQPRPYHRCIRDGRRLRLRLGDQ